MIEDILKELKIGEGVAPNQYSALTLAYIGDCVFELYIRTYLISKKDYPVKMLHKSATKYVKASAQAEYFRRIEGILTEEEAAVFHRGRNANSKPPKNADMIDYKIATGVEALIGYTYLKGDTKRLFELLSYTKEAST